MSLPQNLFQRETKTLSSCDFRKNHQVTPEFIERLGLDKQLVGHDGCVNCVQWSEDGELLASGSDDLHVIVWDPFRGRVVRSITTGHGGNIFSVKFMPQSGNNLVASGAADHKIQLHDMETNKTISTFKKHIYRVKRLEVTPGCPNILWSASEDGTVMETDIRAPPNEPTILVNLHAEASGISEAKCLSMNPVFPEYLAVGGSDAFIRMYDRRKLKCNVIEWPEHADTMREKQNYLKTPAQKDYDWSNQRFCQFFSAGHLAKATKTVGWRRDSYTSTYVTFSPNGRELLANMGSEQIYLFDVFNGKPVLKDSMPFNNFLKKCDPTPEAEPLRNGFHPVTTSTEMPSEALELKKLGNDEYEAERYSAAIKIYNRALVLCYHPILLGNRAAAYLKRDWNGDVYSALIDSLHVIELDPMHIKAHLRLIKCLVELKWLKEGNEFIDTFRQKFPKRADLKELKTLEKRLEEVKVEVKQAEAKRLRRMNSASSPRETSDQDEEDENQSNPDENEISESFVKAMNEARSRATDFKLRFCGHCNTTTDIKEANFFGSEGNFVIAGSDDGQFFVWDRKTTNIIKILRGDESIVNCLQPHPTTCFLATSGIDKEIRLWSPLPEDGSANDRTVTDFDKTSSANQRRMNADPFESFLMDMGYRVRDMGGDTEDPDANDDNDENMEANPVNCRTS